MRRASHNSDDVKCNLNVEILKFLGFEIDSLDTTGSDRKLL